MKQTMDRRAFLGGLSGIMAVSALPAIADDPAVFPTRGKFERLVLAYQHIQIGLKEPFSVLHISDTHLTEAYAHESQDKQTLKKARTQTFGGRQEEALRDSLAWAKANVDYLIHTGDLIDWQSEANFDLVKKYFGGAMTGALGNHEYSPSMWLSKPREERTEAWKDRTRAKVAAVYPFDTSLHSQIVKGVNFVTLDDVYGSVTPTQVERFAAEVKKGLPIILCMHVPFLTDRLWLMTKRFWSESGKPFRMTSTPCPTGDYQAQKEDPTTRDFIAYLKGEKLLKGILAGHEHITMQDRFSPTAMEYVVGGNFMFHGQEILFT